MGNATMIRWPWVSRELYEGSERHAAVAWALWEDLHKTHAGLLEKFTALRLAGAVLPEAPPAPREAKEIDPLKQAVLNASIGKPPSVRAAMLKQLGEDMKAVEVGTMTAMDVQRRIETGFTPDDGIPE